MFAKEDFNILPDHHKWNHSIKLIQRAKLKTSKVYLLSPVEQTKLDAFITKNLYINRIKLSKFFIVVLVFFIEKKDSLLRLVQNYRTLNVITIKNKYSLFLISKLVTKL